MPFYDDNETLRAQYERLPQNIKNHINISDKKITSCEELNELVRRIETIQMNNGSEH